MKQVSFPHGLGVYVLNGRASGYFARFMNKTVCEDHSLDHQDSQLKLQIVREKLQNPLVFKGEIIDLRFYVLIFSVDPLIVY